MKEIHEVVRQIQSASGTLHKQSILRANADVPGLKEVLYFIYNPYIKTGISKSKLSSIYNIAATIPVPNRVEVETENRGAHIVTWNEMIKYLMRHNTGSHTDMYTAALFLQTTKAICPDALSLAEAILTNDLQIGVTSNTLNKVYGAAFIPKVGCMLGTKIGDVKPEKIMWPCIATEKLDGIRRLLIKENGISRLYSRSGHIDVGLFDIEAEAEMLPDNTVYDGELLAEGNYKDCIALRQATSSIANSKGIKRGLTFNVFDMIPIDQFRNGTSAPAVFRKVALGIVLHDNSYQMLAADYVVEARLKDHYANDNTYRYIKAVPILGAVEDMEDVTPIVEHIWKRGGEGVMLNTYTGSYAIKRSKELLKVKKVNEYTLTVTSMVEGDNKYEGMLGALVVDYKGRDVKVGSGFTDQQRRDIWDNPELYIRREVEIESFGESTNKVNGEVSLNCPIFKRFVGEVE